MKNCAFTNTCSYQYLQLPIPAFTNTCSYQYLQVQSSGMLKERTKFVPVLTGALGRIKEWLDQNLQLLPGHLSAIELQKFRLMSIAHSIR